VTLDDIITSYISKRESDAMKWGKDQERARIIKLLRDEPNAEYLIEKIEQ
jgi:hypothetical protein